MANRFWVLAGGTGTWNGTAGSKWSTTSGGASGAAAPTASDDVFFDGNSGTGTITWASGAVARSINCTGYTGTVSHSSGVTISLGDATAGASSIALKLVSGMTYTLGNSASSALSFISTSATQQTITTGGKTLGNITFNASSGGSWKFADANTCNILTLTKGTLTTAGFNVSADSISSSNSNTRTLTLSTATITLSPAGSTAIDFTTTTGLTLNASNSSIVINNGDLIGGGLTFGTVTIKAACNISNANTFGTLSLLPIAGCTVTIDSQQTVSGTFTATGANATTDRLTVMPFSITTKQQILGTAAGTLTNVDFFNISGTNNTLDAWTGTSIGDLGGNNTSGISNIVFTTPVTRYWVGGTGNWCDTSHWSSSSGGSSGATMPLAQDTATFDTNSFSADSQTVTVNMNNRPFVPILDTSAATNHTHTITYSSSQSTFATGNLTLSASTTLSSTTSFITSGESTQTLRSNGATLSLSGLFCQNVGGTFEILDDTTISGNITTNEGTIQIDGNLTVSKINEFFTDTKSITFTSGKTLTLAGTGTVFTQETTGSSVTPNSVNVVIADASSTAKTFKGAGGTWGNMTLAGGGSGTVTFTGANTFSTFTINSPKTVIFPASTTTTVSGFVAKGSSGNLVTIQSSTSGTAATLSKPSGIVNCNWLSLQDSTATGGAVWYAGANSTNVSGNTGWNFRNAPMVGSGNLLALGVGT